MIDNTHDNVNPTSSTNNRILLHESMISVTINEYLEWLKVQVKPGQEEIFQRALQDEYSDFDLLCLSDSNALHIGFRANLASDFSSSDLRDELRDLLVSPDRKYPSNIGNIRVANRLKKIIMELATKAYADIICMESEFIDGFYWLSRAFRDASALLKGEELQFFLLEDLLLISDDFDNLTKLMSKKSVVLTAVCVNEPDRNLDELYPYTAPIDPKITGDLAQSETLGKGAAYYHPTSGNDDFLAYFSWRFHEPIPVEDIQSITAIFKQLSDLGLPTSRYFFELRDLDQDSVFTVFSKDYADWCEDVWYE